MRITLVLLTICLALCLETASSMDLSRRLVNRPKITEFGVLREKRSPVKNGVKGLPPSNLERQVRKGEYVCGNKICKLQPGVVPPGCGNTCQYPLKR